MLKYRVAATATIMLRLLYKFEYKEQLTSDWIYPS